MAPAPQRQSFEPSSDNRSMFAFQPAMAYRSLTQVIDEQAIARHGLPIGHLVLPADPGNTEEVLSFTARYRWPPVSG